MADELRAVQLRRMKRNATGLLVVVGIVLVGLSVLPSDASWTGYALAAAEGSMVGGLADWFAVTALFRHPLRIPIPHTAVIRERKDQFGAALGDFVQQNFLSGDVIAERIRSANVPARSADWLTRAENATTVARTLIEALVGLVDLVGDDDVHRLLHDELDRAVSSVPFGPLAGRVLRVGLDEQRHQPVIDAVLRGAITFLDEQREPLRKRFGATSPWWLPGAVEDRLFDRLVDGARLLAASIAADPKHEMRAALDARLGDLADRLAHDPIMAAKVDDVVREVLAHQDVRGWTRSLWTDLKTALRAQLDNDESRLGARLSEAVQSVGGRLKDDAVLQGRLNAALDSAASYLTEHHRDELSSLISATIERWDAEETSSKLELLLGRDLQFIRINGTVVGGMAGLALHAAIIPFR